jgi:hypothetical protein
VYFISSLSLHSTFRSVKISSSNGNSFVIMNYKNFCQQHAEQLRHFLF